MKLLLMAVVIVLLAWRWRTARSANMDRATQATKPPLPAPQSMVVCKHCGVHMPAPDAVHGAKDVYCSVAHRQRAED